MSQKTRFFIRITIGVLGLILIITSIILINRNGPKAELPDSIPTSYGADSYPSPTTSGDAVQSPLPSDTEVSAAPDLSWEWPVDSDGNLILDPSSNSDIPPDAEGTADADTP